MCIFRGLAAVLPYRRVKMKKFYTFRAGQELPKWIFDFKCDDVGLHQNRHAKITFLISVVAVRGMG